MLPILMAALAAPVAPPPPKPVLVVMLVVDQLRPDYFDRFAAQLPGGLGRLARSGVFFTRGQQLHALTETAPGHATVLSGREPTHTGIVSNTRGVPDPAYPIVGDPAAEGASPSRFRGTTLFDWLVARDSATRVLSVSRKNRGAILPVGRGGRDVYWYAGGRFTTSTWYRPAPDTLPGWVRAWNQRDGVGALAGTAWNTLLPDSAYAEPDTFDFENLHQNARFPHVLPSSRDSLLAAIEGVPWMDSLTLDFALEGVRQTGLGHRARPDLLSVSLSTTDVIGHAFGPDSREVHDQVVRLDQWLGRFLDSLDVLVPGDKYVALTADHGVQSMPEFARVSGHDDAGHVDGNAISGPLGRRLRARYQAGFDIAFDSGLLLADTAALAARGIRPDTLATGLARLTASYNGVLKTYTPATLRRAPASDRFAMLFRRQIPASQGWLVAAVLRPGWIWSARGGYATHGSPHRDDTTVPIIFAGPGIAARRSAREVNTVDIGPTLAALLGVHASERLDGVVLPEVVAPRR